MKPNVELLLKKKRERERKKEIGYIIVFFQHSSSPWEIQTFKLKVSLLAAADVNNNS